MLINIDFCKMTVAIERSVDTYSLLISNFSMSALHEDILARHHHILVYTFSYYYTAYIYLIVNAY